MVHVKKNDANIQNVFPKCICGTAVPQIRRLLLKSDRCVHAQVSEMQCSLAYGSSGAAFVSSRAVFVSSRAVFVWQRSIVAEMISANMHYFYWHVLYHLFEVYRSLYQSYSIACKLCMYLHYILACWSMLQHVIDTHIFLYGHTYTRISWITGFLNVPFQWRFAIVQTIQPFHYLSEGESWEGNK